MKTISTLLFTLFLFAFSSYSQIPNAGFEDWTNNGSWSDPDHWYSTNYVSTSFGLTICEEGTPGNPGAKYVKLTSKLATGFGVLPGTMTSGEFNTTTFEYTNGFPYSQRPASLTGAWQYVPVGNDAGYAYVILSKWDAINQVQDYIAFNTFDITVSNPNWVNFDIPLTYISADNPDTATIVFSSSGGSGGSTGNDGSYLAIDNLAFVGTSSGVIDQSTTDFTEVYPNPTSDFFYILQSNPSIETKYEISTIEGKIVQTGIISGNKAKVTLNGISKGVYFVTLINDERRVTKRVFVQ